MARSFFSLRLLTLAGVFAVACAIVPTAGAVSCSYKASAKQVKVLFGARHGNSATLKRVGKSIRLSGKACGAANVTNTNTIVVVAKSRAQKFTIDLSGGPLAPGASKERVGQSEIEINVNLGAGFNTVTIVGSTGRDNIRAGSNDVNLNADNDIDITLKGVQRLNLFGGAGNDALVGSSRCRNRYCWNVLSGGGGDDTVSGGAGNDYLNGGDGNDTLSAGAGTDGLDGGDGNDAVLGGPGDDNYLNGGDGNDTVLGGPGDDNIDAGDDSDGSDLLSGGAGLNYLSYSTRQAPITITLDGIANDGESGELDNVKADFGRIDAGAGDDTLTAGSSGSWLFGNAGNDTISGGAGRDDLNGGDGNDTLYGGAGSDALRGGAGDNTIYGGDGNDALYGDAGSDGLRGGSGNDTLWGGPGDDGLYGESGDDHEYGDAGEDVFYQGAESDGADVLYGGDGAHDTVNYGSRRTPVNVSLDTSANDGSLGEGDNVGLDGGIESILGGLGNDTLVGNASANAIEGGPGDDYLEGAAGEDNLNGAGGNDEFNARDGYADRIYGDTWDNPAYTNDRIQSWDPALDTDWFAIDVFP